MLCCFNCVFSDYGPYGVFGCLARFRDNKEGYRSVRTKAELFHIWDTMTEFVQETYCVQNSSEEPLTLDTGDDLPYL